jgi:hypothetical protein
MLSRPGLFVGFRRDRVASGYPCVDGVPDGSGVVVNRQGLHRCIPELARLAEVVRRRACWPSLTPAGQTPQTRSVSGLPLNNTPSAAAAHHTLGLG